jgi:predicted ATPase/class 3 adenylate cyclase
MRRDLPAGTVTFLFTDVEGSTNLLHELGTEAYAEELADHRRVVRAACTARGGVEVDTQGDAFFVAFPGAPTALDAARAITEELASGRISLRIGLHTGSPLVTEEGYVGEDVHLAARVAASAHGGQVVLSQATRALLSERYPLVELGEHRLKDVSEPVAIFQLGDGRFPPLKTISNTNLPRPASSFVGRQRELSAVLERFEEGTRLLTLTGPGGSGKTRLALEAAATLVPEYKAGVFWVGLASLRDPALVIETIAHTLGAKDGLVEHVGEREMLLLLDNLEQLIEAAPELSALLAACPNLTLLVTSRELLRIEGEVEYSVPALAIAEAVALFCERAQTAASEEIAELCRRLDSLPLAVELAAARTRALSPAQILERLSQRLDLLKGGRDADPRQQTLRSTIQWSFDLLTPAEQALFARLSVFAGGCTLEAAEEVLEADFDTLESLRDKSLLRRLDSEHGPRFWMLETIREFAAEQLPVGERAAIYATHALYFTNLAEAAYPVLAGSEARRMIGQLSLEHDNVRAALSRSLDSCGGLALRLAASLWRFWHQRGHLVEGRQWLERSLERASGGGGARARALNGAGVLAAEQGDIGRAMHYQEESLQVARRTGDRSAEATALCDLASCLDYERPTARGAALLEEATQAFEEVGDVDGVRTALLNLGVSQRQMGDLDAAREALERAVQFDDLGDSPVRAHALTELAVVRLLQSNAAAARPLLAEALAAQAASEARLYGDWTLHVVASQAALAGSPVRAVRLAAAAAALGEEIGASLDPPDRRLVEHCLELARAHIDESAFEDAWAEGSTMSFDEAAAYALDEAP